MNFKSFFQNCCLLILILIGSKSFGQNLQSTNPISYKITFDQTTNKYTVWVVPSYNTPNAFNPATSELGPTAQTSIALPCSIDITGITDVNGNWQKPGTTGWLKYGPSLQTQLAGQGLDPNTCYYTIGKSPSETDYGQFTAGVPVPLYTFTTSGCAGPVRIIDPTEPVITVGLNSLSWNLANSFYSRSGQNNTLGGNSSMLEQFASVSGGPAICSVPVIATNDATTTPTNTPVTLPILNNDTNNGQPATTSNVTTTILTQPACGSVALNAAGQAVYTPTASCTGTQKFTYQICDKVLTASCSTATGTITINSSIVANPENTTTTPSTPVTQTILSNDVLNGTTPTPSQVNITLVTPPSCGSVSINSATGVATYTPTAACTGAQTYTYKICDVLNPTVCSQTTNTITINPPVVIATPENGTTPPNTPITLPILINDTNNGLPATTSNVTITITSNPSCGTVAIVNGQALYTPTAGCTGQQCFTYKICDMVQTTVCSTATDCITISPLVVVAVTDGTITTPPNTPVTQTLLTNDTDNGQPATISNVNITIPTGGQPSCGSVAINALGQAVYTPTSSCSGSYTYTYQICDKVQTTVCSTATNTIVVSPSIVQPNPDTYTTPVNTPKIEDVMANDLINGVKPTPSTATMTILSQPSCGVATVNADGTVTYTPSNNGVACPPGNYCYTYQICIIGTTNCANTTSCTQVSCASISAVTDAVSVSGTATSAITSVLSNDTNNGVMASTSNVTLSIVSSPTNGTATVNADGTITYAPFASNTATSDNYTYKICDKVSPTCCSQVTNNVSISAVTIVAMPDAICMTPGQSVTTTVLANDTRNGVSVAASQVNVSIMSNGGKGVATVNADGTITYIPNASFTTGTDTYTYKICDKVQTSVCSTATNTISICGSVSTDISVSKTVNNTTSTVGGNVTYTVVVKNNGAVDATGVNVSDMLASSLTLVSSTPSSGTYSTGTGLWTIPTLAAGATATLTINAIINAEGVTTNTATMTGFNGTDTNPANNSSTVCTSVPVMLCQGSTMSLTVPSTYTNVVWSNNGTVVGSGNSYTVTAAGSYTWTASNSTCPATGCCPVTVLSQVCCATNTCIPVTIQKMN